MAAIGCSVEEGGEMCAGQDGEGSTQDPPDDPLRDPKTRVLAAPPWIGAGQDPESVTFYRRHNDPVRRTMRSDSTESVVTTSGGDSSSGSEPGSPARPVTPHSSMGAGGPATYECLRADSEDSGLGPSPAKSSPTSPEGPCSPIRFDDRCSDSLLDLSPRTEEDNNSEPEDMMMVDTKSENAPDVNTASSGFQFLLAASQSKNINKDCEDEDFSRMRFSNCEEEEEEEEDTSSSSSTPGGAGVVSSSNYSDHLLNPKVVLIRSDFGGCYSTAAEDSTCSQQSSSAGCAASEDSRVSGVLEGSEESGACKWLNCERPADANATATDLLDHIRECHVRSQPEDAESFVCLWTGCKVYARPSCSRSWLERHVLLHGGSKPFRCIVAGCRQRFGTEAALQRHVNSHFPHRHPSSHHQAGQPGHRLARNRRNKKHRRRPQSNKSKDFFDDATMEYVRHNLFRLSSIEGVVTSGPPAAITFRSIVKGKRKTEAGQVSYLLSWSPENIVPDVWVSEAELVSEKTIPVSQLPSSAGALHLDPAMDALGLLSNSRKRKRK